NTNKTVKTHCFKVFKEFSQTFLRKLLKQEHQHYKTIEKSTFHATHTRNTPTPRQQPHWHRTNITPNRIPHQIPHQHHIKCHATRQSHPINFPRLFPF
ncbi:hypothetical protein, partial [Gardnerella vaginalis]|uniref:hypothetical protein n=1 Tax=Gardnerella vaginalis TaxID=2702 RepID=UPI00197AE5BA